MRCSHVVAQKLTIKKTLSDSSEIFSCSSVEKVVAGEKIDS
jgi:hypothetical protein